MPRKRLRTTVLEVKFLSLSTLRALNAFEMLTVISTGYISIEGLTKYLMSEDNLVITPERFIPVHQDMSAPLSHYFVNSSHNTYLTGMTLFSLAFSDRHAL